jgi:hypothetical protein
MPFFFRWIPIISALTIALALTGCSAVRLAYNNAPNLAYWWLDGYVDFDSAQSVRVRADLQQILDWHRKAELPFFAETLKDLQVRAPQAITGEQVCALYADLLEHALTVGERMVPTGAAIVAGLQPNQVDHLAREYDKRNRTWQQEWVELSATELAKKRAEKFQDRAESFYGRLTSAQRALVLTQAQASLYDPQRHYKELVRRQQDGFKMLRQLSAANASDGEIQTEIRALLARTAKSADATYRSYQAKLNRQNCANVAALHNSTTPEQRNKAVQALRGYEDDLRSLQTGQTTP